MTSWEPVGIDRDEIGEEDYKWDHDLMNDLMMRFNKLKQFNETLDESRDENLNIYILNTQRLTH